METNYQIHSSSLRAFRRSAIAAVTAIAGSAFLGCAGEVTGEDPNSDPQAADSEPAQVSTVSEGLLSLGSFDFCKAINELGKHINELVPTSNVVFSPPPDCRKDEVTNLYYTGAELTSGNLSDLLMLPYVNTGAYYCALAEANGATVSARSGPFGISSRFDVTLANPATKAPGNVAEIHGRRMGTVYLFGVPFKVHVQDMIWKFPFELDNNSIPPFYGEYMSVHTDSNIWNFDLTATIPVGPFLIKIRPQMHQNIGQKFGSNNAIQFSPENNDNRLASTYDYAKWLEAETKCDQDPAHCSSRSVSAVSDDLLKLEHQFGPCLGPDVGNFNDNMLPYYDTLGGAGAANCYYSTDPHDFIFLDNLKNWFQFGKPSAGSGLGEGETAHNLNVANVDSNFSGGMKDASFTAGVTASGEFNFGFVKLFLATTASMATRDGFAVRQAHLQPLDTGVAHTSRVWTELNAQTKTDLKIHLDLSFPTLPIPDLHPPDITIPIGDASNATVPSAMEYYDRPIRDGSAGLRGFSNYTAQGMSKPNPDQARVGCFLASAATNRGVDEPEDPAKSVRDLARGAVDAVHPCNVRTCNNWFLGEIDYRWDSDSHQLVQSGGQLFCTQCANLKMNLCRTEQEIDPVTGKRREVVLTTSPTAQHPEGEPVFIAQGSLPPPPGGSCVTQ
jgi:hypothetical protein